MNTRNLIPFLLILLSSCGKNETAKEKVDEITQLESVKPKTDTHGLPTNLITQLNDTVINNLKFSFDPIDQRTYDSLAQLIVETTIPLQDPGRFVVKSNSCQLIQLTDGGVDSLCNKKEDSGYHEDYSIKGLWKAKNLLISSYSNWEESYDFVSSLKYSHHQYLDQDYLLSPDTNFIFMYSDLSQGGFSTGGFGLIEVRLDSIQTLFYFEPNPFTITNARWLKDNRCLIAAGIVDIAGYELKSKAYYLLTFKEREKE